MLDMPRARPPYLHREKTRHGSFVWVVRKDKGPRIRIREEYGTEAFTAAYNAAVSGQPLPAKAGKFGVATLGWLAARYRESTAWTALALATRRKRENILKHVLRTAGAEPYVRIDRRAIVAGRDRRRAAPSAAKHFVQTMRGLFQWAVEAELVMSDPTHGVDTPRLTSEGFAVWPQEWREKFEKRWPICTRERVAYEVLLQTGLRRGDAVRFGRPHVKDGIGTLRTDKGDGEIVTIVINARLAKVLKAGPCGELTFIAGDAGRPLTKESFGNWFRGACRAADVPGSAHGLRKAKATQAAESGATDHEIDAMFGWKDGKTSRIYTRRANRAKLALAAAAKLDAAEQNSNIYTRTSSSGAGAKAKTK